MSNSKTTTKSRKCKTARLQQECKNTRKKVQVNNTKVIDNFVNYLAEEIDVEINLPNVFGLIEDSAIESFKEEIPKTLGMFLDYCDYTVHLDLETAYVIPQNDEMINIPFILSKNQYDRLESIASEYSLTIDETVLTIVFIVWNALIVCNAIESGMLNKNNVSPHIEPMLETKKLSPFIEEDEIPF